MRGFPGQLFNWAFLASLPLSLACQPHGSAVSSTNYVAEKVTETDASTNPSPETVFRHFLSAMFACDESGVRETMLQHPGMEILWAGSKAPPAMLAAVQSVSLRRVVVGESLQIPSRDGPFKLDVTANDVNDGRVLLVMGSDPIPHAIVKIDGRWRVDGGEFIAAREAVEHYKQMQRAATRTIKS